MLTRENEGSKKSVRKVVQDFVHQQYVEAYRSCFGSNESHLLWVDVFFVSRPVFGSSKAFRNHQKPHFGAMVWDQTTINIFLNNKLQITVDNSSLHQLIRDQASDMLIQLYQFCPEERWKSAPTTSSDLLLDIEDVETSRTFGSCPRPVLRRTLQNCTRPGARSTRTPSEQAKFSI